MDPNRRGARIPTREGMGSKAMVMLWEKKGFL